MCSAIVAGDGEAGWEEEDPFGMAMGSVDMVGGGGKEDGGRCAALFGAGLPANLERSDDGSREFSAGLRTG